MTGYLHPLYADSFEEFGIPRELPNCNGRIIQRQISGFSDQDAIGCYPLFACHDWSRLHDDFALLGDLVSLSLVTDPFGQFDEAYLRRHFHVVFPFKKHFVLDLNRPLKESVSRHHQYYGRKSLRTLRVEHCPDPTRFLDQWLELYARLCRKYQIDRIRAGSRSTFEKQLRVPGIVMFRAMERETIIGLHLWYIQGNVAYNHLAATADRGYQVRASYALYWTALNWLVGKADWVDLGGIPGTGDWGAEGIRVFKKGWANGLRPVYFCGRIFNHKRYQEITISKEALRTKYFPAYRQGEFG
jgi:hypothetical protein